MPAHALLMSLMVLRLLRSLKILWLPMALLRGTHIRTYEFKKDVEEHQNIRAEEHKNIRT